MTEPKKFDTDKPRYDLLPPKALGLLVDCLTYGAKKYDDYNWRKDGGIDSNRLFAATQRHLWAWKDGETMDKESGLPHLAHAATNLLMMLDLAARPPVKIPNFNPKPKPEPETEPLTGLEYQAYFWLTSLSENSTQRKITTAPAELFTLDNNELDLAIAKSLATVFDMRIDETEATITLQRTPSGHKIRSLLNAKS